MRANAPVGAKGFTFVELMIAATMIAILIVGLAGHIQGGLMVWQRATLMTQALQRQRVALNRMHKDLASAVVFSRDAQAYGADMGKLVMPSFASNLLQWYTVVPATERLAGGVLLVTYTCASVDDSEVGRDSTVGHDSAVGGDGGARKPMLVRRSQTIAEVRAQLEGKVEYLLPGCEQMHAAYGYLPARGGDPMEWQSLWEAPLERLPALVRVDFMLDSGQTLRRVFTIPSGELTPYGAGSASAGESSEQEAGF